MILKTESYQWLVSRSRLRKTILVTTWRQILTNALNGKVGPGTNVRLSRYMQTDARKGLGKAGVAAARLKRLVWCRARDSPSCARSGIQLNKSIQNEVQFPKWWRKGSTKVFVRFTHGSQHHHKDS